MTVLWREYASREAFTDGIVATLREVIVAAVTARGQATLAFSGGKTPVAILQQLAAVPLPWKHVTMLPSDDRIVALDDALSNAGMLQRTFGATAARVVPLVEGARDYRDAGRRAADRLQDVPWPLDLVWLGMGGDGHTASIFPGPDLETALTSPARAVGVHPVPLPPEAPVDRVTLTASAIADARERLLVIEGAAKRAVLERAVVDGAGSEFPMGQVLARGDGALTVHWLP